MKHIYLLSAILILFTLSLPAQEVDLRGHWVGTASYEKQHLVINLDFFEYGGQLVGSCRVPEWEPDMLGTSPIKIAGNKVSFQLSAFGSLILQYDKQFDRLQGQAVNRNGVFDFQFSRVQQPAERQYYNKTFNVPSVGGVIIKGELVIPEKLGKHPVAVIFGDREHGSRHSQRGRALMLARRGIAAFIFDRRGEGESSGDSKNVMFKDMVADGMALVDFVANRENVDPAQIGLIGIGSGGSITPHIAAQKSNIAFLINIAAAVEDTWSQRWHALERQIRTSGQGFNENDIAEAKEYMDLLNNFASTRKGWPQVVKNIEKNYRKKWSAGIKFPKDPNSPEFSWLFRMQNNPASAYKKLTLPVLIFLGEKDNSISPLVNAELAESLLKEAGNQNHKVVILPGAEHNMFIHPDMSKDKTYRWRRMSPSLNPMMFQWLDKQVTKVK